MKRRARPYKSVEVMLGRRVIRKSPARLGPPLYQSLLEEAKRQVKKWQEESDKGGGGAELGAALGAYLGSSGSHARAPETEAAYQAYRRGERGY